MEVISGHNNQLPALDGPLAITMGNFDGVHLGHQSLIGSLRKEASDRGLKTALLTFSPHPCDFFNLNEFSYLLTKEEKIKKIKEQGIDYLVIQKFDQAFASLSPQSFVDQYLLPYFSPRYILLGYDFSFGEGGKGDFSFLRDHLKSTSIEVAIGSAFQFEKEIVSSSIIRKKIQSGDIVGANALLSYKYLIKGVVEKGDEIGRQLGFPTANMGKIKTTIPANGVYWGWAIVDQVKYKAVLNIGIRPTISGKRQQVEAHLLDFSGDLYNEEIAFEFLGRLRDESKFSKREDLIAQIEKDIVGTKELFRKVDL